LNQIKIGKFIADRRRKLQLTQKQLSEQLEISDKTISKWECGRGLPEVELMLPLCSCLQINVNELLSGEKLSEKMYHEKAEENLMNLVKEKEESKRKIIISVVIAMICVLAGTTLVLVAGLLEMSTAVRIVLVAIAGVVMIMGISAVAVLDREAGSYECPECHARFVPTMSAYIKGVHTFTKRYLMCPECKISSMCKRRLTK
jgi:Predicted transcriptional regulators